MNDDLTIKQAVNRLRLWLKYHNQSNLQDLPFYRMQVLLYNLGDIIKYQTYESYYGHDGNPIQTAKDDIASDVMAQFLLYFISLGIDVEKSLEMGIAKLENMEFAKKKTPMQRKMESK